MQVKLGNESKQSADDVWEKCEHPQLAIKANIYRVNIELSKKMCCDRNECEMKLQTIVFPARGSAFDE